MVLLKIVECLPPEKEFIQQLFSKNALDPLFNTQSIRTHYIDIETEMSGSFEYPKIGQKTESI